jgi:MFS family permease
VTVTTSFANARATASRTFASLDIRNYRYYFIGQIVSLAGTWMQTVAQALLVLKLSNSGTMLGFVVALQFAPVLLFGLWAGVVSDWVPKRWLLVVTQLLSAACALTLGLLVATDVVRLWMVFVMAGVLGTVTAFDNPARQSFVPEMVPPERLANAIGLNSVMVNLARIFGPGAAGLVTAVFGLATCFFINAASYLAVVVALLLMRASELRPAPRATERPLLRDGFRYVRDTPGLKVPLILMTVVGTITYEFPVTFPVLAKETFGNGNLYGAMSALQGAGAVAGALFVASRFKLRSPAVLAQVAIVFGALMFAVAFSPTITVLLVTVTLMGTASIAFISIGNTLVQLVAEPSMRGRMMALWSIAFMGSTTIGGPFVGWVSDAFGARYGVALGAAAAVVAGIATFPALRRLAPEAERPPSPRADASKIAPAA